MSRRIKALFPLEGAQEAASDPRAHAALSASAGTGKTHVLTSRVLRLLLKGTPPSSILCLTFTKAGAAEMSNRIAERLAHWVRLPDHVLKKELFALSEDDSPSARQRARRLFARVLDAPGGGIRVQTIHSFAQTLLAAFPGEAGIAPGFRPIEGRAEAELARRTLAGTLERAEREGRTGLLDDVSELSLRLGEQGAEDYLLSCARAHEAMAALGATEEIEPALLRLIGLPEGNPDDVIRMLLSDGAFDGDMIERLIAANLAWGTKKGGEIAERLVAFLAAPVGQRADMLDGLGKGIVTAKGEIAKVQPKQIAAEPDYDELATRFANWLVNLKLIRDAMKLAAVQAAGLRAGQEFAKAYVQAKRAMGVADFDDLITWAQGLLAQPGMGDWVRYKLDQQTDHILVDEAQDTNADQWAIIEALAGEYFSGNPEAEHRWRTLFMVGDYKQAIFGFQGTDPGEYEAFRSNVASRAAALGAAADEAEQRVREFRDLSIDASFRSSPAVLNVVDALIEEVGFSAMGLPHRPNPHQAIHDTRPGRVELWPPFQPEAADAEDEDTGEEGWIDDRDRLYADAIARQVRRWIDEAPPMASTGRPLSAGDILILVRSRTELASLIVARLYKYRVPVAGIDRLHLHKPLAVKDLLAAITFAVQPLDNLNLANLLVSPLVGWDQDRLFSLAYDRKVDLWGTLQRRREENADFAAAHELLSGWLAMADNVTPAKYLETILSGPVDGRRKLIGRLGEAARDPISELVSSAMTFEAEELASLDRFLAWFGQGDVEVKRDPGASGDAVRVMTVHGAKGLEAPLVILADATHDPDKVGGYSSVIDLPVAGAGMVPVVRPRKDECMPVFRALIDEQKRQGGEEHWRLAYVGLTRARERLVIAGRLPHRAVPEESWHAKTARAMEALGAETRDLHGWGPALVWEGARKAAARKPKQRREIAPIALPAWIRQPAPPEARPPRPLTPSRIVEDREAMPPPTPAMRNAARRGTLLHALFERLPATDAGDRRTLALRWLEKTGETAEASAEIADAALSIISEPAFADLFGPDSLGEAPIAATLPDGRVVAGAVDRLCIGPDRVRVIDFKTGRNVPTDAASVPESHRLQMEAYVEALKVIFPGRSVEAALLYTAGPSLITI